MRRKFVMLFMMLIVGCTVVKAAIINGTCGNNLTWSLNTKDSILIITGSGNMSTVYNGVPWEEYKRYIKQISLPDGLTSIGRHAFQGCSNLTSIDMPNTITDIDAYAFDWCVKLADINFSDNITTINERSFRHCPITTLEIPQSVTYIGNGVFDNCVGLTSITIPDNVTTIEFQCFQNCTNLKEITLGHNLQSIGQSAFYNCDINRVTVLSTTPPNGGAACGINESNSTLYVRRGCLTTYSNAAWWEDFNAIIALDLPDYVVQFIDWDGLLLSEQLVENGETATPPANPSREGYTFIGWDKDFSNIMGDLIVTAQYKINRYKVDFLDWDATILKSDSVDWNTAAIAPSDPSRDGYSFIGWDKDFSNIKQDIVIIAQYEFGEKQNFIINFNSKDGEEIISNYVVLKVPQAPQIEGFKFIGWRPVSAIIEDNAIKIEAIYESELPFSNPTEVSIPNSKSQKLIRDGNVYVLSGDKIYTLQGQEVK